MCKIINFEVRLHTLILCNTGLASFSGPLIPSFSMLHTEKWETTKSPNGPRVKARPVGQSFFFKTCR